MALKPFNTVGGLSVGPNVANVLVSTNAGDSNVANYTLSTAGYGNVTLGAVANIHISGGNANGAVLGAVTVAGNGAITAIAITSGGDGYDVAPAITITGDNTSPAYAVATLTAGAVSNITVTNGGTGYSSSVGNTAAATASSPASKFLRTDGTGNLSWYENYATGGTGNGTPGGYNTAVQFNDAGMFGGSNAFIFDKSTNAVTFSNVVTIAGNADISNTAVATITSSATDSFTVSGAAQAALAVRAANGNASLTSNGSSGTVFVGYVGANANSQTANIAISATAATITAAGDAAVTNDDYSSLAVANTGITGAVRDGSLLFSATSTDTNSTATRVSANTSTALLSARGNSTLSDRATATVQVNAASTSSNVLVQAYQGNVTINAHSNVDSNGANANLTLTTSNITLRAAANGNASYAGANTVSVVLDANTGAAVTANTGNIALSWSNAATARSNLTLGQGSTVLETLLNTSNTSVTRAALTLSASGQSNLISSGNIVITSDADTSGTANSAQIVLNGSANTVTIGANANTTLVVTDQSATLTGSFTVTQDAVIGGNLTVQGTTIYANTDTFVVEDPIISLGTGANGAVLTTDDGKDRGLALHTYGDGNTYLANGAIANGSTVITIADTRGIANGMTVTTLTGAIPANTIVTNISANANITISAATTANIVDAQELQIGTDTLRFSGWDSSTNTFAFGSNVTIASEVVTFNEYGNVRAAGFVGDLVNGNSNIRLAANANVTVSANGNSNIFTVTSSGDGNLLTTGAETTGYFTAGTNVTALGNIQSNNNVILEGTVEFAANYANADTQFASIGAASLTTTATTANQAIVKVPYEIGRVVEYSVKSADSTGGLFQAQSITALISAANTIDYTNFGIVGNSAGTITVALTDSNANITLQVTPASTNSTVFTTQYRVL